MALLKDAVAAAKRRVARGPLRVRSFLLGFGFRV